jgi:hypothetical protein
MDDPQAPLPAAHMLFIWLAIGRPANARRTNISRGIIGFHGRLAAMLVSVHQPRRSRFAAALEMAPAYGNWRNMASHVAQAIFSQFERAFRSLAKRGDRRIDLAAWHLRRRFGRSVASAACSSLFRHPCIFRPAGEDAASLGQREAKGFALENHLEMKPVARILPAMGAVLARMQETTVFVNRTVQMPADL